MKEQKNFEVSAWINTNWNPGPKHIPAGREKLLKEAWIPMQGPWPGLAGYVNAPGNVPVSYSVTCNPIEWQDTAVLLEQVLMPVGYGLKSISSYVTNVFTIKLLIKGLGFEDT